MLDTKKVMPGALYECLFDAEVSNCLQVAEVAGQRTMFLGLAVSAIR